MAVFWTSLSGVKNDLPCFLLHAEVTSRVSNLFSGWHYLTALQMPEFIHSSNCQSHLTILSELILIRNLLIVSVMTIDNFFLSHRISSFTYGGGMCQCHSIGVEIRGLLVGDGSFLPPCGFPGSNIFHQVWLQVSMSHLRSPLAVSFWDSHAQRFFKNPVCICVNILPIW